MRTRTTHGYHTFCKGHFLAYDHSPLACACPLPWPALAQYPGPYPVPDLATDPLLSCH